MITTLLFCQCDSIVTKTCGALIPVVKETYEAGTSCYDVSIVDVICKSLVIIVAILVAGFLAWKIIDHNASENEREFKKQKEKEESERKQKSDLIDKYLDFLKEQTKEKEFVTMEELENQRRSFADALAEHLKNVLSLYLCTNDKNAKDTEGKTDASKVDPKPLVVVMQKGANNETQVGLNNEAPEEKKDASPKETNEDKPKETTQPKAKDEGNDNNEKKKQSLYNLIEELKKYIHPEKLKPAEIDQAKIERYRKALEYLIKLSQQGKLNEFSIEELDKLFK